MSTHATGEAEAIGLPAVSKWGWAGELAAENLKTLAPVSFQL
jgi:hypothetical protein